LLGAIITQVSGARCAALLRGHIALLGMADTTCTTIIHRPATPPSRRGRRDDLGSSGAPWRTETGRAT